MINTVDKERLPAKSYIAKEGKESVNFAFPFTVPDGEMLLDVPLGVMRPEADQMPSACKNWFTVGRWADVSNANRGVTWVTLDAPLVQVGGLTATLLNSQTNPNVWRKTGRADAEALLLGHEQPLGHQLPRLSGRPDRVPLHPAAASPARPGRGVALRHRLQPAAPSRSRAGDEALGHAAAARRAADVLVTALKPSDDGQAMIVRLFGASAKARSARLKWGGAQPQAVFLSDTSERPGKTRRRPDRSPRRADS